MFGARQNSHSHSQLYSCDRGVNLSTCPYPDLPTLAFFVLRFSLLFLCFSLLIQGFPGFGREENPCFFRRLHKSCERTRNWKLPPSLSESCLWKCTNSIKDKFGLSYSVPLSASPMCSTAGIRSHPGKPNQRKASSWTFPGGTLEPKFDVNRACFPTEKHQNSQKWAKFMNFSSWPFLWFGLLGRLLKVAAGSHESSRKPHLNPPRLCELSSPSLKTQS